MQLEPLLRAAAARIGGGSARLDAEVLAAHVAGVPRLQLLLTPPAAFDAPAFNAAVARRAAGEPVAYITGRQEFWSLPLAVTPDVLIPRPDSETLVAVAVAHGGGRVLDLGTGSGALLLAVLHDLPGAWGLGVDRSMSALAVARANAAALGVGARATWLCADWSAGVAGRWDVVLTNPPYVATGETAGPETAWEPAQALYAGADGLDDYRRVVPALPALMAPDAVALLEIGWRQAAAVTALGRAAGLTADVLPDLAGRDRCVRLRK